MRIEAVVLAACLSASSFAWADSLRAVEAREALEERDDRPRASDSEGVREAARAWTQEELRALADRDPAGFRDILRRNLTARLLWTSDERPLPPDLPVELAGH